MYVECAGLFSGNVISGSQADAMFLVSGYPRISILNKDKYNEILYKNIALRWALHNQKAEKISFQLIYCLTCKHHVVERLKYDQRRLPVI